MTASNLGIVTRNQILQAIRMALIDDSRALALLESGAAAFDRIDEWSDIDLVIVAVDGTVEELFHVVDAALEQLSPIEIRFQLPRPTWHGHDQVFYRLARGGEYLLVDLVISEIGKTVSLPELEIHGQVIVHFNKVATLIKPATLDREKLKLQHLGRIETLRQMFQLFQSLTKKELNRGNSIEAMAFYHSATLRPLIELLRIRHAPERSGFHTRYIHYDLPKEAVEKLESLWYVASPADLEEKRVIAERWFHQLLQESDGAPVDRSPDRDRPAIFLP